MKKIIFEAGVLIIVCILAYVFFESVSAEEIVLEYTFTEPEITEVNISNTTFHNVTMNESVTIGATYCPMLPVKPVRVLLPQNGTLVSINVTYSGNTSLGDEYNVTLGPEFFEFNSSQQNQSNQSYFNSSKPYPTDLRSSASIYGFRGYTILVFNLYPVHYINDTGDLYYYENMTVTILTNESGNVSPLFRKLASDEAEMIQRVDDYSMNSTYTLGPNPPPDPYDMIIITKAKFMNEDGIPWWRKNKNWLTFQNLSDYKNESEPPIKTFVKSVEAIYADEKYEDCYDNAEKIREYIKDKYECGIKYVLLGGDEDVVPVRKLWSNVNGKKEICSDLYYACLDGTYNANFDEEEEDQKWWGEQKDGEAWGEGEEQYECLGGGNFYAEADSLEYDDLDFNVGLFTPAIDLSDYDDGEYVVKLNFSGNFQGQDPPVDDFAEVKVYSGETILYEETLKTITVSEGEEGYGKQYEFPLDPENYTDAEEVYIEFYYNDDNDVAKSFNIDDICVKVQDGDGWIVLSLARISASFRDTRKQT